MTPRYLSVCSGIEAASVAWHPLEWEPIAFAEIDPFASAVLAHRYPDVPNLGDMEAYGRWSALAPDVLVGGTPCQSFSVAGLRAGMADPRGNLALVFLGLVDRFRPAWVVWENVPGVRSADDGEALGAFLGGLGQLGYGWSYRSLDAQYDGLAQRRQRVFVVGHSRGRWTAPCAVLFEPESLRGDSAPRREAGERIAPTVEGRASAGGGGWGTDFLAGGGLTHVPEIVPQAMSSKWSKGTSGPAGDEVANLIAFDTTQLTHKANRSNPKAGDPCHPLASGAHVPAIAFNWMNGGGYGQAHDGLGISDEHTPPLSLKQHAAVASRTAGVRRLTPRECERLQGFPDDYTLVPYRGKPASDGPRYKALGNSMAVPVVRWIGERIMLVEQELR